MAGQTIDAQLLARMLLAGANNLEANKEWINDLNVFPVPDGDTGTNMCMTIQMAVKESSACLGGTMQELAKAIAKGSLRGARGNSGVILSQLFRGMSRVMEENEALDSCGVCEALRQATESAYKAVMAPKEGTILTVARAAADKAAQLAAREDLSMDQFLAAIVDEAERVLALTPTMLPVLAEAGVVDSGGQGLVLVMQGALAAFRGEEEVSLTAYTPREERGARDEGDVLSHTSARLSPEEEITFGYCTEFLINIPQPLGEDEEADYRAFLNGIGDSIVLVADDAVVKTHVHTNDPGLVLQKALSLGSLSRIKIDNMREEHQERLFKNAQALAQEQAKASAASSQDTTKERGEGIGFLAISVGDGMTQIFRDLGADGILEGGQTMNPSTEDILTAADRIPYKTVFVFPNNKNIILAANQAAKLSTEQEIVVIPTTTIPQGITALISYVTEAGVSGNREMMLEAISTVKTGQITYAIRDTSIKGREIAQGDYMGIGDDGLLAAGKELSQVVLDTAAELVTEDSACLCLYYGEDVSETEVETLGEMLSALYPDCEVDVQYGGQPIYYYIISVE